MCKNCKCYDCGNLWCPTWLVCREETCTPKDECSNWCWADPR